MPDPDQTESSSGGPDAMAAAVTDAFRERFGRDPDGVWAAPGRVNLIGEHTDYNDGFVLPFALDKVAVAAVGARDDDAITLVSLQQDDEVSLRLRDVTPGALQGWGAYAAGPLWALAEQGAPVRGIDLVLTSDVPVSAGLSSSAAVESAVILAATELYGGPDDRQELARLAQRAENEIAGAPTGIMDQTASLAATQGCALFFDTRSGEVAQVPLQLDDNGLVLLVVDTHAQHSHSDGPYRERREACERAAHELGVPALRDLTVADLPRAQEQLDDVTFRRARHVVTEDQRVLDVVHRLRAARPELIGSDLLASHASMRDDFEISVPELDAVVDASVAAGALGARMTGGGFGGCAIVLVERDRVDAVVQGVRTEYAERGWPEPSVLVGVPSAGARRLS